MHLTITQPSLSAALGIVGRAAAGKTTLPVLSNVLLEATDAGLMLSATNLELCLQRTAEADVQQPGAITLPCKLLAEWVGLVPGADRISLDVGPRERVTLSAGRMVTKLSGIPADDFPPVPAAATDGWQATLDGAALKTALEQVQHAIAHDSSRPVLAGMLLRVQDGTLTLAGADGYRLAIRLLPALAEPWQAIVPGKTTMELARLLSTDPVTLATTGNQLLVESGGTRLVSRLIDGLFPDYARIIPTSTVASATLDADALLLAVRAAQLVAADAPVRLSIGPDGLTVRATSSDGEHEQALDAETDGELSIGFNGAYLRDAITATGAERVTLACAGPSSPAIVRAAEGETTDLEVVSPVFIASDTAAAA